MPSDVRLMRLSSCGIVSVTGPEARSFLHAQLTNNIERMGDSQALRAGWCSAKGRLLATCLVVPTPEGFLLQLARDLAPAVSRRLALFILRAKVKVDDASAAWMQYGIAGADCGVLLHALELQQPDTPLAVSRTGSRLAVNAGRNRYLLLVPAEAAAEVERRAGLELAPANEWALEEIRARHPLVSATTQEMFVPQMLDLHKLGAIDFKKGCYPGQEVVARTQYRGELKRRLAYAKLQSAEPIVAGQALYSDDLPGQESGTVVNAARQGSTWELLVVVPVSAAERGVPARTRPEGIPLEVSAPTPTGNT